MKSVLKRFAPQPVTDFGPPDPLGVGQEESTLNLRSQDTILCGEAFVAQQLKIDLPVDANRGSSPLRPHPPLGRTSQIGLYAHSGITDSTVERCF